MSTALTDADLDRVAAALGVQPERSADGHVSTFTLADAASGRRLSVDVVRTADGTTLVKVYGRESHLELHDCTGVVAEDDLGEALFFARAGGRVAGLVVEREAACSLFSNVEERLLTSDFMTVAPEVAQAAVVLSMAESMFEGDGAADA